MVLLFSKRLMILFSPNPRQCLYMILSMFYNPNPRNNFYPRIIICKASQIAGYLLKEGQMCLPHIPDNYLINKYAEPNNR